MATTAPTYERLEEESLVFRIRNHETQVLAVMHLGHQPGYWMERSSNP